MFAVPEHTVLVARRPAVSATAVVRAAVARAVAHVPSAVTATVAVPTVATVAVPPVAATSAVVPPVATAVVPPVATAVVPPVATAVVPPVATAVVPSVATAVVPSVGTATVAVPSVAAASAVAPPVANAVVPPVAAAVVPVSIDDPRVTAEVVALPPGVTVDASHDAGQGAFTVLRGAVDEEAGGRVRRLLPGQVRLFGPGYRHRVRNSSAEPAFALRVRIT